MVEIYKPPDANLVDDNSQSKFLSSDLTPNYFLTGMWCVLGSLVIYIALYASAWLSPSVPNKSPDYFVLVYTIPGATLGCYSLMVFRKLLVFRLQHTQSNRLVIAIIVLNIASIPLGPYLHYFSGFLSLIWIGFFAVLVLTGVVLIWLGINLVRIKISYSPMKLLGWLYVVSGVLYVSVMFYFIGVIIALSSSVPMVVLLYRAAKELRESGRKAGLASA